MHDIRFEDLLRQTLRDEADSFPFTISTDLLERRLVERGRTTQRRRWLAASAAAVIAVAVVGGGVLLSQLRADFPPSAATPSPSPSGPTALPEPAALLTDFPPTTILLESSVGLADGGADPLASADNAPVPVEAGRVTIDGPFILAFVCRGPGDISVTIGDGTALPVDQTTGPCNGTEQHTEYLSSVPLSGPDGFAVTVTASSAASWRIAVAAYTADLGTQPDFPPITVTPGWNQLVEVPMILMSPTSPTGANFVVPTEATRVGVLVQCQGDGSVTFAALTPPVDPIDCRGTPTERRFEITAVGGERLSIGAAADGFIWIRLVVETDADLATTYPTAPTLPAAVAGTPYSESIPTMLGIGTVGGNHQTVLPMRRAGPGITTGEVLPVNIYNGTNGSSSLVLLSIPDGEPVATVATVQAPGLILASWADAKHQRVYYAMTPDQRQTPVQYHRVGFDGSDDRVIAEAPTGVEQYLFGGTAADLSLDGGAFVVDSCEAGRCRLTVIDTETGEAREIERSNENVCSIVGVSDADVVAISQDTCDLFDANVAIVAFPLDGTAGRVLVEGEVTGQLVAMPTGARFVYTRIVAPGAPQTIDAVDLRTGGSTVVLTRSVDAETVIPRPLRLPDGWVLLATFSLGDFPQAAPGPRAVPIMLDLVSGKQYEMVNLPH